MVKILGWAWFDMLLVVCLTGCIVGVLWSLLTLRPVRAAQWIEEFADIVVDVSWIVPEYFGQPRYRGPRMVSEEMMRMARIWSGEDRLTVDRETR